MMKSTLRIDCLEDPTAVLTLGKSWVSLCNSPTSETAAANFAQTTKSNHYNKSVPETCERNFVWALSTLSLIPESQRNLRLFTANRGSEVIGILPLIGDGTKDHDYWEILGSRGVFGDGKGIIARTSDQIEVGCAFAQYIADEWIGASRVKLIGLWENDQGMRAFYERFSESTRWSCEYATQPCGRLIHRITQGPDGNPMWPLAVRRRMHFVHKALESGLFQTEFSTQREAVLKNAMVLRNMLRNDAPALKSQFGPVSRTQRILDYRFGQGIAPEMCQEGTLRSCLLRYKSKPIAGAIIWDVHQSRRVVWLESKATAEQAQLVFWMMLSQLIEEGYKHGIQDVHLDLSGEPWTASIPNLAAKTWNAEMNLKETVGSVALPSTSSENRQIQRYP